MAQERNYDQTGGSDGVNRNFIKLDAKAYKFVLPDGTANETFVGYFNRANLEWKDADAAHKLPGRWHFNIILEAKIAGEVKEYEISTSSHWGNPILGKLANGLLGCMLKGSEWSDMVKMVLREKKPASGGLSYCDILCFWSTMQRDFMPNAFEWDDATQTNVGVPRDMTDANDHWLACAREVVLASGGQIIGEDKAGFGFVKYTGPAIPKRPVVAPSAQTSTPDVAAAPSTPSAQPAAAPIESKEVKQANYLKALKQHFAKMTGPSSGDFVNQANAIFDKLLAPKVEGAVSLHPDDWGWNIPWLIAEVSKVLMAKAEEGTVDFNTETQRFELNNDLPF